MHLPVHEMSPKMHLLFSEAGIQRIDEIVQPGLLCAFDFDGTLAPIESHPANVQLPYDIQQRLITLSRYVPIAIITGRSVQDAQKYLGFSPDFIIGNHGIEGLPGWNKYAESYQLHCNEWEQTLSTALQNRSAFDFGIRIENKCYSLSVHYRAIKDNDHIEQKLINLFTQLTPSPRVISGKNVFNLLPQDAADKGVALEKLMSANHFSSAIYVGDDVTDEDVFRLNRPDVLTVRIENSANSAAEFFLRQRQDIKHLLDELIVRLRLQRKTHLSSASRLADRS
jgi:trehalose 6-phosphate phosphatase